MPLRAALATVRASMKRLLWLTLLATTSLALAQETPTITISKSDKLSIAVTGLGGELGKVLQNDLTMSGYFKLVPGAAAGFTISGSAGGNSLSGKVEDHGGKTVLSKTFSGSVRQQAHQFADEIVETLTGNHGMASTRIAFVGTRTGKKEVYLADADGSNITQLTHDNSISVAPRLSTDAKSLLYTSYKSGYADVYEIQLASGARNRIIKFPGTNSGAVYSPDGNRLAVTMSKDGNPELYITSSSGGSPRRLTRTPGVESSPTWSPDGGELIYSSDERGTPQLYRISAAGGSGQLLSTGHGYNTEPNWSPDGKKVAFNVRENGSFAVAILELASGHTRTVGEGQDPVWGADSRHLIFASGGSVILLDAQTGQKTTLVSGLGQISEPAWSR
ncbi:MAG: tolB [Chthoniobacteraceae bacterium]|nr:tolB [Chthoniobacteraceae bacterium]